MPATLAVSAVDSATAGRELMATVTASAPAEDVRVALVCTEQHRQKAPVSGQDTAYTASTTEAAVDLMVELIPDAGVAAEHVEVVVLMDIGALDGAREVRLMLPDDVPPTTTDLVDWTLRAFAEDGCVPAEQPVVVASEVVPDEEAARFTGTGDGDSEQLRLEFPGGVAMVRAGDVLRGALVVQPRRTVKLAEVRVRLELLHRDTQGYRRMDTLATIAVGDQLELEAGTLRQLPFELTIPADAPPSFRTARNAVYYFLHVSGARRMRGDLKSSVPLYVLSPAAAA